MLPAYLAVVAIRYSRIDIQDWNTTMTYAVLRNIAHKSIGDASRLRRLMRRMDETSMHRQADIVINSLSERGMHDMGLSPIDLHGIARSKDASQTQSAA